MSEHFPNNKTRNGLVPLHHTLTQKPSCLGNQIKQVEIKTGAFYGKIGRLPEIIADHIFSKPELLLNAPEKTAIKTTIGAASPETTLTLFQLTKNEISIPNAINQKSFVFVVNSADTVAVGELLATHSTKSVEQEGSSQLLNKSPLSKQPAPKGEILSHDIILSKQLDEIVIPSFEKNPHGAISSLNNGQATIIIQSNQPVIIYSIGANNYAYLLPRPRNENAQKCIGFGLITAKYTS